MAREIVGGLLVRLGGRLFATSVRHEIALCPACWRCGAQLFLDTTRLVASDEDAHPWTWVCAGCVTDDDRAAMAEPDGRGVK